MKLNRLAIGSSFRYGGFDWSLLDRRDEKNFCLTARDIACITFDRAGKSHFPVSSLYGWLNGSFIDSMAENGAPNVRNELNPVTLDCFNQNEPTTVVAMVGLLSFRQARIYQERIRPIMRWWWTCTPCDGVQGKGLRCLSGKWSGIYAYYPPISSIPAVRPTISLSGSAQVTEI